MVVYDGGFRGRCQQCGRFMMSGVRNFWAKHPIEGRILELKLVVIRRKFLSRTQSEFVRLGEEISSWTYWNWIVRII